MRQQYIYRRLLARWRVRWNDERRAIHVTSSQGDPHDALRWVSIATTGSIQDAAADNGCIYGEHSQVGLDVVNSARRERRCDI